MNKDYRRSQTAPADFHYYDPSELPALIPDSTDDNSSSEDEQQATVEKDGLYRQNGDDEQARAGGFLKAEDYPEKPSTGVRNKHNKEKGWGQGILQDWQQTVGRHWKAEMTNFNLKTIAVSFFLYFACISPAITFGAIYEKATHNYMGAVEMITATAWCGIVYALIGGQPMVRIRIVSHDRWNKIRARPVAFGSTDGSPPSFVCLFKLR